MRYFHMKTRVSLKYFVNDCLWKQLFSSNSSQIPPNLISLTILETLRPFTQFSPKIRAIKLKKSALLGSWFSDLFTEIDIWY